MKKRTKIHFNEITAYSNTYKVSYKNVVKRLLEEEIITASNAKYTNIYINKKINFMKLLFTEEPYNYEKNAIQTNCSRFNPKRFKNISKKNLRKKYNCSPQFFLEFFLFAIIFISEK
ncbi:MAG: hypothetical protein L6V78_02785 [Clostridium sp.]|nr:MAG: hypothetical protein L6V78_02785 [Clostridium sp.]